MNGLKSIALFLALATAFLFAALAVNEQVALTFAVCKPHLPKHFLVAVKRPCSRYRARRSAAGGLTCVIVLQTGGYARH